MPTGQNYSTNVPQTTLTSQVNATTTTFPVASSTGWPSTPFTAVVDVGLSTQEPVDVTTIVGTTWTVTRNIDGTVGFAHANGATVTHADIGRDFRESRAHIDAASSNDSTGHAVHGLQASSAVVGTTDTQTLTNKTATQVVLDGPRITNTVPTGLTGTQIGLYSNAGVLTSESQAGTSAIVTPPGNAASWQGNLIACSMDPTIPNTFAAQNGVIVMERVDIYQPISVTNVLTVSGNNPSGLTANQNFAGIYNSSGTRVAVSADMSSTWTGGVLTSPMTGGPIALQPGTYYIAILENGTTPPTWPILSSGNPTVQALGFSAAPYRHNVTSNGQTSLPASITLSTLTRAANPMLLALS